MALVETHVTGIYGTLHTNHGDVYMGAPQRIVIDCETMIFFFPMGKMPFAGTSDALTLHYGTLPVRLACNATWTAKDNLTIVQRTQMASITPASMGSRAPTGTEVRHDPDEVISRWQRRRHHTQQLDKALADMKEVLLKEVVLPVVGWMRTHHLV